MDGIALETLKVAEEYPLAPFQAVASAEHDASATNKEFDSCENHLDQGFMERLRKGEHLDLNILPL